MAINKNSPRTIKSKKMAIELTNEECYSIMIAFETEIEYFKKGIKKLKKYKAEQWDIDDSLEILEEKERMYEKFSKLYFDATNPLNKPRFTN